MADFLHAQHGGLSRRRGLRLAGQAAEFLILLALFGLAALWVTGAPVRSFLPIQPPA